LSLSRDAPGAQAAPGAFRFRPPFGADFRVSFLGHVSSMAIFPEGHREKMDIDETGFLH
jgi:hypothetical protein